MWSNINIDALRVPGGYRPAPLALVREAVATPHTCHLETERGVVAFRPYTVTAAREQFPGEVAGQNWLIEFLPRGRESRLFYRGPDRDAAVRFALLCLNGRLHAHQAGDAIEYWSNQADREATVLAVEGDEVLIEYVMPGTSSGRETSAIVLCRALGRELTPIRTYPHAKVPRRWIESCIAQGTTDWIGEGQRSGRVPFPQGAK